MQQGTGISFFLYTCRYGKTLKEIVSIDLAKVSQNTDIPTKTIQENAGLFPDFLLSGFTHSV